MVTLILDFDKAFYRKYQMYFHKFKNMRLDKSDRSSKQNSQKVNKKNGRSKNSIIVKDRSQSFAYWLQYKNIVKEEIEEED